MKYRAGFLTVTCVWMVILTQSLGAGTAPKKLAAGVSCRPRELTALTKRLVEDSRKSFDEANGKHLGTWSPGFPELQVDHSAPVHGSKVQCSLLFMSQGLEKVLEDQRNNLNPGDTSLHKKLENTISNVNMLATCMKDTFGGECTPNPAPPQMPQHAFERKQWSHTLLKTARDYLDWLEHKIKVKFSNVKGKNDIKRTGAEATRKKYLEGSGYLL